MAQLIEHRFVTREVVSSTYPYNKFDRFDIDTWDDSECRTDLRFGKEHLDLLRMYLQIPDEIVWSQRSVCEGGTMHSFEKTGLTMSLHRYGTTLWLKSYRALPHL